MNNPQRKLYIQRINRVLDHIDQHLGDPLDLEGLAGVAAFSPYHFHRIFRAMVGEPLNQYVRRIRLEKAASLLVSQPDRPVLDIAVDCGFGSAASFARAFKEAFGCSASQWRDGAHRQHSKMGKVESKAGKSLLVEPWYVAGTLNLKWKLTMQETLSAQVEVKELPEMPIAYVRHIGPYQGDGQLFTSLFGKLMQWAGPRGLFIPGQTQMLSAYHEDPDITDAQNLRVTVAITVPADTPVEGEIGYMTLPAGRYAVARFELADTEYGDAWDAVYRGWLPESGYEPADGLPFEWYRNDPRTHPEGKQIVDICVPVKPV